MEHACACRLDHVSAHGRRTGENNDRRSLNSKITDHFHRRRFQATVRADRSIIVVRRRSRCSCTAARFLAAKRTVLRRLRLGGHRDDKYRAHLQIRLPTMHYCSRLGLDTNAFITPPSPWATISDVLHKIVEKPVASACGTRNKCLADFSGCHAVRGQVDAARRYRLCQWRIRWIGGAPGRI